MTTDTMEMTTVSFRVDTNTKKQMETVLERLGISTSAAMSAYAHQIVREGGIPFRMTLRRERQEPSVELLAALREADDMAAGRVSSKRYNDLEEYFADTERYLAEDMSGEGEDKFDD